MALWGKTDTLGSKPKYLTKLNTFDATSTSVVNTTAETITIPSHGFATGDAVAYEASDTAIGGLTDGTTYFVIRVDANTIKLATTASNATAGTAINLSAVGAGDADTLQLTAPTLFFVDSVEAVQPAAIEKGITGAGWWLYREYFDSGAVLRRKAERLVAMSGKTSQPGTTGDGEDDNVLPDRTITITTQPQDDESAAGSEVTFSVTATVSPSSTLFYQWQLSEDDGETFANISGATASSLVIGDNTGLDGNQYRVVINSAGAYGVTSDAATLTVA